MEIFLLQIIGHNLSYLVSLLNKIILNEEKTNPFSVTKIIRYDNGNFTEVGDIFDAQEQDFKMIYIDKNYLYTDFLIRTKTRLSKNDYQNVGAIIVGTQNPVNIDKARINQFSKMIFNTKLMKKKFNENK